MRYMFPIIIAVYLLANVYIYVRFLQQLSTQQLWVKIVGSILFWCLATAMVVAMLARNMDIPAPLSRALFNGGAVWMLFVLYMVLALICTDIARTFIPGFKYGFWVSMVVSAAVMVYGHLNYLHPDVNVYNLKLNKSLESPLKVVAISDIHLGEGTGLKQLRRYVDLVNAQNPDVIVIAGDLIDNSLRPLYRDNMDTLLCQFKAPFGIYMVPGNHEYISRIGESEKFLKRTSIKLLRDSIVELPGGLQIVGRDDRNNRRRATLEELLQQCNSKKPVLQLDHQPYNLAKVDSLGVDMQISGHTHRGQVWPLSLITDYMYEQSYGYRKWNNAHIYVSSGLSLWGPPFRIGTHSEIAVFTLF